MSSSEILFIANQSYSVFRDCIFEVTRANSIHILFYFLNFAEEVALLKLSLLRLRMNAKDFSLKCWQIIYCVTNAFARKLLVAQFCKVNNYVFRSNDNYVLTIG